MKSKGILAPLIENFLTNSTCEIESPEDVKFLTDLATTMLLRENARDEDRVFGSSGLGNPCLRVPFFTRHAEKNPDAPSPYGMAAHFYFMTGTFIHLKWQFVLYKLEKYIGNADIFHVYGNEITLKSKRGDIGGTPDSIVFVHGEPLIVDFKGLNQFTTKQISLGRVPSQYRMQCNSYVMLWNAQPKCPFRINRSLLLVEDKGWSENVSRPFLHEVAVPFKPTRLRRRLKELREHEAKGEIPPLYCRSLNGGAFKKCQFRTICWSEVEKAQKTDTLKIRKGLKRADSEPTTTERVIKALRSKR